MESVEKALSSPLLDTNIGSARAALVDITGSRDMTLEEAEMIVRAISERIDPEAEIIWGAHIDEDLDKNVIKTFVILSGVNVPGYEEKLAERAEKKEDEPYDMTGLKYV
jgi:cell division protein FtsZ